VRKTFVAVVLASCAQRAEAPKSNDSPIVTEWASSFHRASFTNPTYQESLALEEPKEHAFCNGCHAPARDRSAGVDCATCHQASVAARDTCRTCHEFNFPGRDELVQKTFTEHASSDFAAVACIDCHMPARDGHRDHRFLGGHSPDRIARALHVDVERSARGLRVSIRVDAGHFFPTGDMFRRARLVLFAERADGAIVADAERIFGRTWAGRVDGMRTETSDTRIRGQWSEEIAFPEPSAPIARVRWSVVYERIVAMRPPHINLASSDVLASGDLAWN
jgi:hypothetical protein